MKKKALSRPAKNKHALELRHRINVGRVAIKEQVAFFRRHFGRVSSDWKADASRVTFADIAISEKLFACLESVFPKDNYCSEEMVALNAPLHLNGDFSWILDPVDGTNNFALGFPLCAISLALLHRGMPVYGFVYDHSLDVIFEGGEGFGFFQDQQVCNPLEKDPTTQQMIGLQFPLDSNLLERCLPLINSYKVRALGSSTLLGTLVAKGYLLGAIDTRAKVWDIAATYAFARAVGNRFEFLGESPFPLQNFHPSLPNCPYYTGSSEFCKTVVDLLA
ncbi:MAG: hypothetical protein CML12_03415 [Puniceicoccaceae bacterium]|nr:hypothetical protein [Puniceicoccaceae bacterium]RCL30541.1 MAG: inositol monophosphatase family protein [Puniceicoccaceae bacterium]